MEPPESSVITAIEPQARRPDHLSLYLNGELVLAMPADAVAAAGLRVGREITAAELRALQRDEELRRARDSALALLGCRARSRTELERRLARQGYAPETVEETLAALGRSGLVDDAEFSRSWVRSRSGTRPMGAARVAAELRQKGVDRETIRQALAAARSEPDAEMELALAVGRKKVEQLRETDTLAARRKLGALLMRRGFSWEICARVLDLLFRADGEYAPGEQAIQRGPDGET